MQLNYIALVTRRREITRLSFIYLLFISISFINLESCCLCCYGIIKSRLLTVKKNITIPHAELYGLLLMCEFVPSIVSALKPICIFNTFHFWTDTSILGEK